jgi:hypothetical protein
MNDIDKDEKAPTSRPKQRSGNPNQVNGSIYPPPKNPVSGLQTFALSDALAL